MPPKNYSHLLKHEIQIHKLSTDVSFQYSAINLQFLINCFAVQVEEYKSSCLAGLQNQ
jgi:hypothetical protein